MVTVREKHHNPGRSHGLYFLAKLKRIYTARVTELIVMHKGHLPSANSINVLTSGVLVHSIWLQEGANSGFQGGGVSAIKKMLP